MSVFRIVIPARYGSSRLPGKPLVPLAGKPMVRWVWEKAMQAGAQEVIVATDDDRIARVVTDFGADACMTSADHESGTDRLAEVAAVRGFAPDDVVVNLQGDEPAMPPALLAQVASALDAHPEAGIATLATPIAQPDEVFDPNVVKVTMDRDGLALYFSRAPIPWVRGAFGQAAVDQLPSNAHFLRHLGLYAYRTGVLAQIAAATPAPIEQAEALEQLRAMWLGIRIHVTEISTPPGHGVDTRADLARAEAALLAEP